MAHLHSTMMFNLPSEVLGRLESFLAPSDCAHLSGTCRFLKHRWNAKRWECTFHLHYGPTQEKIQGCCDNYHPPYALENRRILSYVGFCDEACGHHLSKAAATCETRKSSQTAVSADEECSSTIQFNVSSLLPSVYSFYVSLWENIEHAMLGYRRCHIGAPGLNTSASDGENLPPLSAISDWMHVMLFMIGLKPMTWNKSLSDLFSRFRQERKRNKTSYRSTSKMTPFSNSGGALRLRQRRFDPILAIHSTTTSMSAWKLACILKEQGMDCIRCRICNKIDLGTSPYAPQSSNAWIRPCHCSELVHRRCLERKLGLQVDKLYMDRRNRRWLFYDDTMGHDQNDASFGIRGVAEVDEHNHLTHPLARCGVCGSRYSRSVRLPYDAVEVLLASLVDPLSLVRAFSTFAHFILCLLFICGTEGMQNDDSREYWTVLNYPPFFVLKWPMAHGWQLAGWQLQQCLMLHIFFSPRFAAIVDRLWLDMPSRAFYCKLYSYFVVTSFFLSLSLLPQCQRVLGYYPIQETFASQVFLSKIVPILDVMRAFNLFQYIVVSTMVVCIFWRTNIRVFTIADSRPNNAQPTLLSRERRHSHPIYHGQWE